MFHANIEAGIEHVCNISNRNFQKFPLAFRVGQFVNDTFIADNLTCMYNVESIETYYGSHQSQRTGLTVTLGSKVMTVTDTVIRVMYYYVHVQCTSQCYLKMESQRIEFTFEEHPLLNMGTQYRRHNKLN